MKAIVFDEIGDPLQVLRLADVPVPEIKENEVLVKMVAASINPGDFLFIQNLYPEPKKPVFPGQIAGNHGAGIIVQKGAQVQMPLGTLVGFSYYNTWAEYAAVPAKWLIPLPAGYPVEKAGQLMNPITSWDLLAAAKVKAGDWLAVTAGNSSISIMVAQFAKAKGVNVIAVVRKMYAALPAEEVIDLSKLTGSIADRVMEITGGKGINALVDSAGGPVTGELIRSMALGGQVVINGGMSPERFELHNFDVLLKLLEIRAAVYRYFFDPPTDADTTVLNEITRLFGEKEFKVPVGGLYMLDEFKEAITATIEKPQEGKRLFKFMG